MSMFGKMSVGVRRADATPKIMISTAMTTKVYGRRSASLTMPIIIASALPESGYHEPLRGKTGGGSRMKRNGRHGGRPSYTEGEAFVERLATLGLEAILAPGAAG